MNHIIAINGFKQSGKGTVAGIVNAIYNDGDAVVYDIGFAHKLKQLAALSLGFERSPHELIALMDSFKIDADFRILYAEPHDREYGNETLHQTTGRSYLQQMGTRARELFGEDFWVDQVLPNPARFGGPGWFGELRDTLDMMYPDVDCLTISDTRFENEAERVRDMPGGVVWEVVRPGTESDGHASEQPLPPELIDWQIVNDGDLKTLEARVEEAMSETLG